MAIEPAVRRAAIERAGVSSGVDELCIDAEIGRLERRQEARIDEHVAAIAVATRHVRGADDAETARAEADAQYATLPRDEARGDLRADPLGAAQETAYDDGKRRAAVGLGAETEGERQRISHSAGKRSVEPREIPPRRRDANLDRIELLGHAQVRVDGDDHLGDLRFTARGHDAAEDCRECGGAGRGSTNHRRAA